MGFPNNKICIHHFAFTAVMENKCILATGESDFTHNYVF
jgi:hypothetical protein